MTADWPHSILVYCEEQIIGDGYIQLPFVHGLRHRFPDAHITWMAYRGKTVYASTLSNAVTGVLDEILEDTGIGNSWSSLLPFRRPLADRKFDLIIDMQAHVKQTLIARRIRHDCFISATRRFLFSDRKPAKDWRKPRLIVDQYLALLDLVRPAPDTPFNPPDLLTERHRTAAEALLPAGPHYVGLVPGAGDKSKCWPLENYIQLARQLLDTGRIPVFLLGPDEADWLPQIRAALPQALFPEWNREDSYTDMRGPLLVTALGERLEAAVANDCGTAHMLAAADTPILSLFGHTNPDKYRPNTPHARLLLAPEFGSKDIAAIPVASVRQVLDELIHASGT